MRRAVILSTAVVALSGQVANRANAFRLRRVKSARNPLHSQAVAGVASDEGEQKDETPDELTEAFRAALAAFKDANSKTITDGDVNGESAVRNSVKGIFDSAAMVQHVNYMFGGREGKTEKGKGYNVIVKAFHRVLKPYRNRISKKDLKAFKEVFEERLSSVAEIGDKQKKESLVLQKQTLLAAQEAALKEVRSDATAKMVELEMHYATQLSACKSCERQLTFAEKKVSEKEAQIAELAEKNRLAKEKISEKEAQIAELVENNRLVSEKEAQIAELAEKNRLAEEKISEKEAQIAELVENNRFKIRVFTEFKSALEAKNHKLEAEKHKLAKRAQEAMERYEKAVSGESSEESDSGDESSSSSSGDESDSGSSSGDESDSGSSSGDESGSSSGDSDESTDSREDK